MKSLCTKKEVFIVHYVDCVKNGLMQFFRSPHINRRRKKEVVKIFFRSFNSKSQKENSRQNSSET